MYTDTEVVASVWEPCCYFALVLLCDHFHIAIVEALEGQLDNFLSTLGGIISQFCGARATSEDENQIAAWMRVVYVFLLFSVIMHCLLVGHF